MFTIMAALVNNWRDIQICWAYYWFLLKGIFEKHKLLFSFQITIKLEQDKKNVTQEELDFFIKVEDSTKLKNKYLKYLRDLLF